VAPLADPDPDPTALFRRLSLRFTELIREETPDNGRTDAQLREPPKKSDWPGVVELAKQTLTSQVKDLRVPACLQVGLGESRGFAGLRDGLDLLAELIRQRWDTLLPPGNNPRARAEAISRALDDEGDVFLPGQVRLIPIVRGARQGYGYLHHSHTPGDGLDVD